MPRRPAPHRRPRAVVLALAIAPALAAVTTPARGATYTWDGDVGAAWAAGAWTGSATGYPGQNASDADTAIINGGTVDLTTTGPNLSMLTWSNATITDTVGPANTVTLAGPDSTANGTVVLDAAMLRVASGAVMAVQAGTSFTGTGTVNVAGTLDVATGVTVAPRDVIVTGQVTGRGTLQAGRELRWGGAAGRSDINADVYVASLATANLQGGTKRLLGATFTNDGQVTWSAGGVQLASATTPSGSTPATFENLGTVTAATDVDVQLGNDADTTAGVFVNTGTFEKSGAKTLRVGGVTFTNGGTLDVQAGTVEFTAGAGTVPGSTLESTGIVRVAAGAALAFTGGTHTVRTLDLHPSGTVRVTAGRLTYAPGAGTATTPGGQVEIREEGALAITGQHAFGPAVAVNGTAGAPVGTLAFGRADTGASFDVDFNGTAAVRNIDFAGPSGDLRLGGEAVVRSRYVGGGAAYRLVVGTDATLAAAEIDANLVVAGEVQAATAEPDPFEPELPPGPADLSLSGSLTFVVAPTGVG
ncbi:MAG TPA: hypothetical protein VK324_16605, partial [Tepidisphaeraceae bacterium]|nr:hypothetical protein [Tepidisphaeraceae bacterium]